jgi:membrane fusion protein (multidrug efflux system)
MKPIVGAGSAMKPIVVVVRRPVIFLMLVAALAIGGCLGLSKMGADNSYVDSIGTEFMHAKDFIHDKFKSYFHGHEEQPSHEPEIVVTTPKVEDVVITESFVCQIRSQRHIEIRALEGGYLDKILINEGQAVKKGDLMFQILPVLYKARLDAENAKAKLAKLKYGYTQQLVKDKVVSQNEAALVEAEMAEAQAKAKLAAAELNFTDVRAPFDGIADRLLQREGSLI